MEVAEELVEKEKVLEVGRELGPRERERGLGRLEGDGPRKIQW